MLRLYIFSPLLRRRFWFFLFFFFSSQDILLPIKALLVIFTADFFSAAAQLFIQYYLLLSIARFVFVLCFHFVLLFAHMFFIFWHSNVLVSIFAIILFSFIYHSSQLFSLQWFVPLNHFVTLEFESLRREHINLLVGSLISLYNFDFCTLLTLESIKEL